MWTSFTFTHWDHCIGSNHRHLTNQSSDHEENYAAIYCDGFPEYTFENFRTKGCFSQSHPNRSAFSFNGFNSPSEAMGKIGKQNGTARDFLSSSTCTPWNMDFSGFFFVNISRVWLLTLNPGDSCHFHQSKCYGCFRGYRHLHPQSNLKSSRLSMDFSTI